MPLLRFEHRLGAAYAAYLAGVCLAVTFWPLHFEALGLTGAQIGLIFSVRTALNTVAQPTVTGIADRTGKPILLLRLAFIWGALLPATMLFTRDFWWLALAVWTGGFMTGSIIPLLDSTIVQRVGPQRFGEIRLWGSVGYGLTALIFGAWMSRYDSGTAGYSGVIGWVVVMTTGALITLRIDRRKEVRDASDPGRVRATGRWISAPLILLFAFNALHWWAITAFNIYFSLHVKSSGYGTGVTGLAVATAIVGEVAAFALARRFIGAAHAHVFMPVVYLFGALRWIITALAPSAFVLIAVQSLHLLGFGVWMTAMIHLIGRYVDDERRPAAQGMMGGIVMGVGGMLGSGVSGALFDIGGGELVYLVAALAELLACLGVLITWRFWLPSQAGSR